MVEFGRGSSWVYNTSRHSRCFPPNFDYLFSVLGVFIKSACFSPPPGVLFFLLCLVSCGSSSGSHSFLGTGTAPGLGYCTSDASCNSVNGGGTCQMYTCICNPGFSGYQCENSVSSVCHKPDPMETQRARRPPKPLRRGGEEGSRRRLKRSSRPAGHPTLFFGEIQINDPMRIKPHHFFFVCGLLPFFWRASWMLAASHQYHISPTLILSKNSKKYASISVKQLDSAPCKGQT